MRVQLSRARFRKPEPGSPTTGEFTPSGWKRRRTSSRARAMRKAPMPTAATSSTGACRRAARLRAQRRRPARRRSRTPPFNLGFEGLNHYQQRYSRGGNQFSVEPPDQGMCAGNGYVVEAVNDVFNVFSQATGASLLPDNTATNIVAGFPRNVNHAVDLNSFYGYPPAVNRTTGVRGAVRDRSDLHLRRGDAAVLRRRAHARDASRPTGAFTT